VYGLRSQLEANDDSPIEILAWPEPATDGTTPEVDKGTDEFLLRQSYVFGTEGRVVLAALLKKLDMVHGVSAAVRRRRMEVLKEREDMPDGLKAGLTSKDPLWEDWLPEDCYMWEEGHFDSVIHHFREAPISSFPPLWPEVEPIVDKLAKLTPFAPEHLILHALHLSARGYIEGHVDNVEASGGMIMGLSLGAPRIMRMTGVEEEAGKVFQCLLGHGDVYVTSGVMRYKYKHEILKGGTFKGKDIAGGQRMSLMFRDVIGAPTRTIQLM